MRAPLTSERGGECRKKGGGRGRGVESARGDRRGGKEIAGMHVGAHACGLMQAGGDEGVSWPLG